MSRPSRPIFFDSELAESSVGISYRLPSGSMEHLANLIRARTPVTSTFPNSGDDGDDDGDMFPTSEGDISPVSSSPSSSSSSEEEFDNAAWDDEWSQFQGPFAHRPFWSKDDAFYSRGSGPDWDNGHPDFKSTNINSNVRASDAHSVDFNVNRSASSDIFFDFGFYSINNGRHDQGQEQTAVSQPTNPPLPPSSPPPQRRRCGRQVAYPEDGGAPMLALAVYNWRRQRLEMEAAKLRAKAEELAKEAELKKRFPDKEAAATMVYPLQRGEEKNWEEVKL